MFTIFFRSTRPALFSPFFCRLLSSPIVPPLGSTAAAATAAAARILSNVISVAPSPLVGQSLKADIKSSSGSYFRTLVGRGEYCKTQSTNLENFQSTAFRSGRKSFHAQHPSRPSQPKAFTIHSIQAKGHSIALGLGLGLWFGCRRQAARPKPPKRFTIQLRIGLLQLQHGSTKHTPSGHIPGMRGLWRQHVIHIVGTRLFPLFD